ncbi:MAG TPA: alpha-amylase family protein [Actinotalea caeni]|uniref:alpha-amylase family protein n=1 Tax=Actinotalea caeni TaxID=1348467 RepID=UPI002B4AFE1C|nr:alpha-amylase family protein [Actinotalea caeni]HLV55833.1 alpha-amylase family protein [Actinotalea caeni]
MRITETSDMWWKNAVVYCLDVETFLDSDGDGVGDLAGLAQRIDYLAQLGVTCLWLMPFYPSPQRDDGYDVTDMYGVDRRYGDPGHLVEVIRTAHDRGMRVIADLLVNHTSDKHPWFVSARRSTTSRYRDYYVWRDTEPPDTSDQVVFPDKEDSIWELDERTGEWYLHHFYRHQPDLNVANPAVVEEIIRVIEYWLEVGMDGFRVDAVPFFVSDVETGAGQHATDPHRLLEQVRAFLVRRRGDAVLLGEVNLPYADQVRFFGDGEGNQLHMMFDFAAMQATYLSFARGDARPLRDTLARRPEILPTCQWATFLRNHDELTLDQLSEDERQEVFDSFGADPELQLYGRGLRRRLPPMLDGDPRRIRMAYSLLFSLPGSPTLFYGEEIGMGENLDIPGRMSVRSPMQWSSGRNGGFSSAAPSRLPRPVTGDGYAPEHVNVADQTRDPGSLWSCIRSLIWLRRTCPEIGWGRYEAIDVGAHQVFAHRCDLEQAATIALHNLGPDPVVVTLPPTGDDEEVELVDAFDHAHLAAATEPVDITLDGYGYRWLRLRRAGEAIIP